MKLSELLDKPETWTKRANARTALGMVVSWRDDGACCWCLSGAARRCHASVESLARAVLELHPGRVADLSCFNARHVIVDFNDHPDTTFDDVRKVILRAEEMEVGR